MSQPFDCSCGSGKCLGKIQGAEFIKPEVLGKYTLNEHIKKLKREQVEKDARLSKQEKEGQLKYLQ